RVPAGAPSPARRWATSRVEVVDANNSTRGNPSTRSMSSPVAQSNSTSLPTSVNHRQDSETEYDTIEREYPIAMTADIPHQNRNRQPAGHRRRHDAGHQLIGESAFVQSLGTFEHHGRGDDRHAHQKTELRRALAVETQATRAGNRRART